MKILPCSVITSFSCALGNHNGAAAASAPIRSGPSTPQQQSRPGFFGNKPGGAPGTPQTPGGTPARIHTITSLTPYQNR